MDISPHILAKLLILGQCKLSREKFEILLQKIYFDLINCFSSITPDSAFTHKFLDNELIGAHYTISMLILETAKNSIGEEALKCSLEDCLWPQNMIDTFIKFYSVNQFSQLKVCSLLKVLLWVQHTSRSDKNVYKCVLKSQKAETLHRRLIKT